MVKPAAKREAVSHLRENYAVGMRRACGLMKLSVSSYSYRPRRRQDEPLREALRSLAARRRRWGYRMLGQALRREGFGDNHKRIYRVYREERLQVRVRRRRKAGLWRGPKPCAAQRRNERWSLDFMSDQLANGRRIRVLNVIDDHTRECLASEIDSSIGGHRVCRVLDRLVAQRGHPRELLSDNGPEFAGSALARWAYEHCVEHRFIEPGKPVQNAFMESFNGTMRNECLNEHWFAGLDDARRIVEAWRVDYNECRPHSSLGGKTPAEFATCAQTPLRATPSAASEHTHPHPNPQPNTPRLSHNERPSVWGQVSTAPRNSKP
jgi:putative transposase